MSGPKKDSKSEPGTPGSNFQRSMATKLHIGSLDEKKLDVEAMFNPSSVQVKKNVPWSKVNEANKANQKSDQGQGIHMEFTGADGRETSVDLLFDGVESGKDVSASIAKLEKLASVRVPGSKKEDERRPHQCVVTWGNTFNSFKCVITDITTKYTMFDKTGNPLRATVTLTLKEADSVKAGQQGGK